MARGLFKSAHRGAAGFATILLLVLSAPELAAADAASRQTARTPEPANATAVPALGITLAPSTSELRKQYGIAHAYAGPVVTNVDPNGPAAQKLSAGDEIVQIGSEVVSTPEDAVNDVEALQQPGRASALIDVVSPEGYLRFLAIPMHTPAQSSKS